LEGKSLFNRIPSGAKSGAIFAPVLLYATLSPSPLPFMIILSGVVVLGLSEFYDVVEKGGYKVDRYVGIMLGVVCLIIAGAKPHWFRPTSLIFIDSVVIGSAILLYIIKRRINSPILMAIVGVVYVSWMLCYLARLHALPNGGRYLLGCFLMSWMCDFFAYLVGGRFGRHSFMPKISPKKTIEGACGGLFASVFVSFLLKPFLFQEINLHQALTVGFVVGVASQAGDICESLIKRDFGVKDSGALVPGHGGLLDVFDSLILGGPAMFYCLMIYGIGR
jgi:phosphatidate cytidylyltransferase